MEYPVAEQSLQNPIDARPADAERFGDGSVSRHQTAAGEAKGGRKSFGPYVGQWGAGRDRPWLAPWQGRESAPM
jgi:hypothetical protein